MDKHGVARRNERINGKTNQISLDFMAWIKIATVEALDRRQAATPYRWEHMAIRRELARRNKKESEGKSI